MVQKVYLTGESMATFVCPRCESSRTADVSRYKTLERAVRIKVKCACGHIYSVDLERRKQYRKSVRFNGAYTHLSTGEKGTLVVVNLSRTGVKIRLNFERDFNPGDKLMVNFHLDDGARTFIEKEVVIRKVARDSTYGTEFTSVNASNAYDKAIGFYMFG